MSTPTLTTALSDPTPDPGGSPDGGGGGMQRGASYFFGFLITFVVLLLIFVSCGVVSRRRFSARQRARFEWDMEPWAERMGGGVGYVPPVLLEKTFMVAKDQSGWKDLIPLAALVMSPCKEKQFSDVGKDVPTSPPLSASNQTPYSPPVYGSRDIDQNLEVITRTLSAASRRRSTSLTRVSSGHSGLVRITSPTPYHRNPNVVLAQQEAEEEVWRQQNVQGRDSGQEQEPSSRSHDWLHYLNPASWFRLIFRRQRERGPALDTEQGTQDTSIVEKPQANTIVKKKEMVLQVAMLITMPSQTMRTPEGADQAPTFEIGVATVPWTDHPQNNLPPNSGRAQWPDAQRSFSSSD
ncbi:hypothetical protein AN958_10720 [Leucoagaricus sp. SymC.cos]|nr:hypothetical protein AN958_10720 [Leucoagaricus sp. SymC.cos]